MNTTYDNLDSIIQLSEDKETLGFDLSVGETWIYPTNYQIRDYQYDITKAAIYNNTLVSLPTGLGKTFIAAVVMYNFYRWYPMGKIIFMAPTRPLVKQQQDACYNIMAIPPEVTAEITGNKISSLREKIWKEKRVFFITPQILQNDIDVVLNLAQQIKCLVIDEAHKALGKHANCEAIKKIHKINKYFRIVALSATPGNNFNSVKDVINNLLISHIEVRTNESEDVAKYVFKRKLDTFIIPITGELLNVKNQYIMILDKYTRPLLQLNIISGNCANLTKGRILFTMKEFKEKKRNHPKYSFIVKTLNLCITLYHAYELLIRHGLQGFLVFFEGTISKPLINSIQELHGILDYVKNYLGPRQEIKMLPDGTIPEINGPIVYSHPKFEKLNEILIEHFTVSENEDTRVMVFCEYRESVMEIYEILLRQRPLIKPRVFLGQGAISQAQQLQAVKQFKNGTINTLISTCIGEEGIDVGEVDLIVCFDISSKSPIRMVQRMGRTGRKRDGRVVVLVTEGKEQQLLSECMVQKNNMNALLDSNQIKQHLYTNNPKMIPSNIEPKCNKMFIAVESPEKPKKITKKNTQTLKNMFDGMTSKVSKNSTTPVKSKKPKRNISPQKNQIDIRNMFSRITNSQNISSNGEESENMKDYSKLTSVINTYLDTKKNNKSDCKLCNLFGNNFVCSSNDKKITIVTPKLSLLNSVNFERIISTLKNNFSPEENKINNLSTEENKILQFFNLESTYDIFLNEDSPKFASNCEENEDLFQNLLSTDFESTSPVLFTQKNKKNSEIVTPSTEETLKSVSTPKNELNFWNQSLFEYNSDDSLFEEEKSPKNSNKNDSDETIILSFENKSTIDSSLLSITQAIDLLNDSKFNNKDTKICDDKDQSLLTLAQSKKRKCFEQENKIEDKNDSIHNIEETCNKKLKLETKPNISQELQKKIIISDSDDDFEELTIKPACKWITPVKQSKSKTKDNRKKKKNQCIFIDNEAEVELDEHYVSDSPESEEQSFDSSFVSYTQNINDQTDMTSKYLQSIRSPKLKAGAFKIPHASALSTSNVFSQVENYENETYVNDSFCVDNEQVSQREEMSYLELIEDRLEKKNARTKNKKRKRIIVMPDSD